MNTVQTAQQGSIARIAPSNVTFDAAMLLMIATSDTLTVQPLQYVLSDFANVNTPSLELEYEYEPIMTLIVPP